MNMIKQSIVFLAVLPLLFSCTSTKEVMKKPPYKFNGLTLSKKINKDGPTGVAQELTSTFNTQDAEVIALCRFNNLDGNHKLRWEWYDPNGDLYHSTNNFPLKISKGNYVKEATPWHKLSIRNDKASDFLGEWEVLVFFDNDLLASKSFMIEKYLDSVALPEGVLQKPFPKDWGLIIGIEEYSHLPNVDYARKDAQIMKDYFIRVLGVPEHNIISLIDSDATKARIEGYLKQYLPANVEANTTLYVYFAGHGAPDIKKGNPYLIPYDGDTKFLEQTGYRLQALYDDLNALKVQRSYVFLDSCFSGVAARAAEMLTKGARPALLHVKDVELKTNAVISFSATSSGQISNADLGSEHGLFTYYLLKALSGEADENDDRLMSVEEIYQYVNKNVARAARRIGSEQVPTITPSLGTLKDISVCKVLK